MFFQGHGPKNDQEVTKNSKEVQWCISPLIQLTDDLSKYLTIPVELYVSIHHLYLWIMLNAVAFIILS